MRYLIFSLLLLLSYSSQAKQKPQLSNYARQINELVYRLSCDANDKKSAKKLEKTYYEALAAYNEELERVKNSGESLPWTKTYDLLDAMNRLSEEIMYNSAANHIICEPEFFDLQLDEARANAVHELYDLGTKALDKGTFNQAKAAYFYFEKAGKLVPKFRDVDQKMQIAKEKAILKIQIEPVVAYAGGKSLITNRFSETIVSKLQAAYLNNRFVQIYTPAELKQRKIFPDQRVEISFIDIDMQEQTSLGTSRSIYINGVAELKVYSGNEEKPAFYKRIPSQYIWKSYQSNSDSRIQTLFDSFSLSMTDQVFDALTEYISAISN